MSRSPLSRTVEILSDARYVQAESPRWDARDGGLAWIDMATGAFHRGRIEQGRVVPGAAVRVGDQIGAPVPLAAPGAGWAVAVDRGIVHVSDSRRRLAARDRCRCRFYHYMNDGGADPFGRFWVGSQSMPRAPHCALWSLEPDGTMIERLAGVTVSNGLAFDRSGSTLYYIDTLPHRSIEAFDVAPDGRLSRRRTVCKVDGGNPDGMTIDDEGMLWVAVWDRRRGPALLADRAAARGDRASRAPTDGCRSRRSPAGDHDGEHRAVGAHRRGWGASRRRGRGRRLSRFAVEWGAGAMSVVDNQQLRERIDAERIVAILRGTDVDATVDAALTLIDAADPHPGDRAHPGGC